MNQSTNQSKTTQEWNTSPHKVPEYPHDAKYGKIVDQFKQWCIKHLKASEGVDAENPHQTITKVVNEASKIVNAGIPTSVPIHNKSRQLTFHQPSEAEKALFETVINLTAYRACQIVRQRYARHQIDLLDRNTVQWKQGLSKLSEEIVGKIQKNSQEKYSQEECQRELREGILQQWNIFDDETKRQNGEVLQTLLGTMERLYSSRLGKPLNLLDAAAKWAKIKEAENTASTMIWDALNQQKRYDDYAAAEKSARVTVREAMRSRAAKERAENEARAKAANNAGDNNRGFQWF